MTTATREQQRNELHKTIWSIADDLRGSVDGWDFKQYILGMLFYRFISENLCSYLAGQEGDPSFDYAKLPDEQAEYGRAETVREKGFFILPSALFSRVLAPPSKADLAFTMHMLSWLSTEGTAAIVEFPGVLYRGGAEGKIRDYLVRNNFVDASDEFVRADAKNKLARANIDRIAKVVIDRTEEAHLSRLVPNDDVLANDANLSVSSYVQKPDDREEIDITAFNAEIERIVAREQELREAIDEIIVDLEGVA